LCHGYRIAAQAVLKIDGLHLDLGCSYLWLCRLLLGTYDPTPIYDGLKLCEMLACRLDLHALMFQRLHRLANCLQQNKQPANGV
jgi:hypothetical protein